MAKQKNFSVWLNIYLDEENEFFSRTFSTRKLAEEDEFYLDGRCVVRAHPVKVSIELYSKLNPKHL